MQNGNDVVMIDLDRPRELRYGHKALKKLVALTGKSLEDIENEGMADFELVEKMVYCGLLADADSHGETLQQEQMEDLLDAAPSYKHIIDKVREAFSAAFGAPVQAEVGNAQAPAEQPADAVSEPTSTSRKASA